MERRRVIRMLCQSVVVLLALSACTVSPGQPPAPGPPAILAFWASNANGPSPLTTALRWTVPVPETSFTCSLDLDDDDVFEVTIPDCTSASSRSATFATPGTNPVRLRVTDGETTVTSDPLTLTVLEPSADAYDITLRLGDGLTPGQGAAFTSAANRLTDVVRTGLSDAILELAADDCVEGSAAFSGTVDDVLVDADVSEIDGPGGTLAQAGPCVLRSGGGLPVHGLLRFDSADIGDLESAGQLQDVVLHEMMHVLGFGILWDLDLVGVGTADPRFVGPVGRGAWDGIVPGTATAVPVEAGGGPGTADAHWRESVIDNELMTGFLDSGANPLSTVSIGALADLGYGVDLAEADPYSLPLLPSLASRADGAELQLVSELIEPRSTT